MQKPNDHGVPSPNGYIYNTAIVPKTHITSRKRGQKDLKARGP